MSLIYADVFNHWDTLPGTTDLISGALSYNSFYEDIRGTTTIGGQYFLKYFPYNRTVIVYMSSAQNGTGGHQTNMGHGICTLILDKFNSSSAFAHCHLQVNNCGRLAVYAGNNLTDPIAQESSPSFRWSTTPNFVYNDIEFKVVLGSGDGEAYVRINGKEVINATGLININTSTSLTSGDYLINAARFGKSSSAASYSNTAGYYKNCMIIDSSGSYMNDFTGPIKMQTLFPVNSGYYNEWTSSSGAAYTSVDERNPNSGVDYIRSYNSGERVLFDTQNLGTSSDTIHSIYLYNDVYRPSGGTSIYNNILRYSGVDYTIPVDKPIIEGDYLFYGVAQDYSPFSSGAWTQEEINNLEFGLKSI